MKQNNVFRHIFGWLLLFVLCVGATPVFAANISGTVYDSSGTTPIIEGWVEFYTGDPCDPATYNFIDLAYINPDGTYALTDPGGTVLLAGDYYLKAFSSGNHVPEWWAGLNSSPVCGDAQIVTVAAVDVIITGKNFQLDSGATISGTVKNNLGVAITDGGGVEAYTGDPCAGTGYVGLFNIDLVDGTYTITGLPAGNYYLNTFSNGNHIPEWWADPASSPVCTGAQAVIVGPGATVTGKDFQLDIGATISGTVTSSTGVAITDGYVDVYTGFPCGIYTYVGSSSLFANGDGTYAISGLPAGDYFLKVYPNGNYSSEWWAFPASSPACAGAQTVTVTVGGTAPGTNFQLDSGATISGTVYDSGGATAIADGGSVIAYTGPLCSTAITAGIGSIGVDGTYTIGGLPVGDYYLKAYPAGAYVSEWWATTASTPACLDALPVTVATTTDALTLKNFQLNTGFMVTTLASPVAGGTVTGGGTITSGDTATLTATPATGYTFTSWSGDATGTTNPLVLTVDSVKNITANFTPDSFTVTTSPNSPAGGTVTGGGPYFYSTTAILTAVPTAGYAFIGWSGDATGTTNPLGVPVYSHKNITANFALTYTITTSADPVAGGTVTGGGIYTSGTTAILTAIPATGYVFTGWSGDVTETANPLNITAISSNKNITANFTPTYTVTPLANLAGGGSVTGGGVYTSGDIATLTAIPAAGYAFIGWNGDGTGTANPLLVTVTSNKNVIANFAPTYTVTTSVIPTAGGTVTGGGVYISGDTATLTATPAKGYVFTGWSGDVTGKTNPLGVTVDSAKNIIANFAPKGHLSFPIRAADGTIIIISM